MEVMGPLLMLKMALVVWFPLLAWLKRQDCLIQMRVNVEVWMIAHCCRDSGDGHGDGDGDGQWREQRRAKHEVTTVEMEFVNLISSIEVMFVYGWSVSLLVPLYCVALCGYYVTHQHLMAKRAAEQVRFQPFVPLLGFLYVSLIAQQVLGFVYWYFAHSRAHGWVALSVSTVNVLVCCLSAWWYWYK